MVASEGNRTQSSFTTESVTSQYNRPAAAPRAPVETAEPGRLQPSNPILVREPFWFLSLIVAGATIASMWALGAAAVAILGLCFIVPQYMLPIAAIVLGLGFTQLAETDIAWERMFRFTDRQAADFWRTYYGGATAVLAAGVAAIVLGILNLVFLADVRLAAVAVIAMGAGLFLHSGIVRSVSRLTHEAVGRGEAETLPSGPFAFNALSVAPVRDAVIGVAGIVLGILAVLHIVPVILALAGMLAMGAAVTFTASTICGASLLTLKEVYAKSAISGVIR